jgi:hypothetical protein
VFWKDTLDIIFDIAATAAVMEIDLNNKDDEHSLNKTKVIFPGTLSLSLSLSLSVCLPFFNSSAYTQTVPRILGDGKRNPGTKTLPERMHRRLVCSLIV